MAIPRAYHGAPQTVMCLQCVHCHPSATPPEDAWREKACADHHQTRQCGWDRRHAIEYIQATDKQIRVVCTLFPKWEEYWSSHFCGQFELMDNERSVSAHEFIHGTWVEQHRDRLTADNKKLRKELKATRERSASRLKRLRQTEGDKTK